MLYCLVILIPVYRLWHQFTDSVSVLVSSNEVKSATSLVEFFNVIIVDCASKLNPLSHAYIAIEISKQIDGKLLLFFSFCISLTSSFIDIPTRLDFLTITSSQNFIKEDAQSLILFQSTIAELKVLSGDVEEGSKDLEAIESNLDSLHSNDSSVYASFYKAKSLMYKAKTQINEFYKAGLQYLSYAQMENVDKEERAALAFDLGIAALVGEDIFNFGELVCIKIRSNFVSIY